MKNIVFIILGILALTDITYATHTLKFYNNSSSIDEGGARVQHRTGALEGRDGYDSDYLAPPTGSLSIYSDVNDGEFEFAMDARPLDSITPFDLKLLYNGTIGSPKSNHIRFEFGTESFDTKPIMFQSDLFPYGLVVDIRKAITQNGGEVPLIDIPAGTYSNSSPYGYGILTIGTRLLADLDDSNEVNFEDFAIFAEDWQKGPGQYVADICGPNGIPDGYVDNYDLAAFCEDWLKDINDPSTW